jgi:hypothetical protein
VRRDDDDHDDDDDDEHARLACRVGSPVVDVAG